MLQEVRSVIFDMDGLLLDSEPVYKRVWTDAAAQFGYELRHDQFLQLLGRGRKGALEKLKDFYGASVPLDELNSELSMREARYFKETPPLPKSGAVDLLDFLEERRISKAVATSNRGVVAEERLTHANLRNRFPILVTVDQVSHGKPAPDIFLKAAAELGSEPTQCVVLEDSEQGIHAARAAQMCAVLVPDLLAPHPELISISHHVFSDLTKVKEWLMTLTLVGDMN